MAKKLPEKAMKSVIHWSIVRTVMKTYDHLQAALQILYKLGGLNSPLASRCLENNTTSSIIPPTKQKPQRHGLIYKIIPRSKQLSVCYSLPQNKKVYLHLYRAS